MIFLKKTKIPQLLFSILVLSSCGQNKKTTEETAQTVEDTLPKMKPLGPEKKISQAYKNSVTGRINHFYNKNWPGKSANGAFLVAKNGQIIFEKYQGMGNFLKKEKIAVTYLL